MFAGTLKFHQNFPIKVVDATLRVAFNPLFDAKDFT